MTLESDPGACAVCKKESKTRCSACSKVFYCCVEHQKADWKNHKNSCCCYKICTSEKFGRHLVASRNIKAEEIVIKESPIIKGPSQITGPVCVGCLEGLEERNCLECEKCGWPICSPACQKSPDHQPECEFTIQRGSKVKIQHFVSPHPTYQCLNTLRCLLLKENSPDKWKKLQKLESHTEQREGTEQWRSDRAGIAQFISRFFKCDNKWTEDEILKTIGILQINGHEVPLTEPPYVAIFDAASMFEHSCVPNITKSFSKNGDVIFWASKPIRKGENLSISYTDVIWGTFNRRNHLLQTKMFKCSCDRCLDRTELNTFLSGLKCNEEQCDGMVLPVSFDHHNESWNCLKCSKEFAPPYIANILDRAGKDFECMNRDSIDHCTKYIEHYSKWLAPNHYRLVQVKIILLQLIGNGGPHVIQSIPDHNLTQKINLSMDLLKLCYVIAPSETRLLGTIHFEMHAAKAEVARRETQAEDNNTRASLEESLFHAEKTAQLLIYEPDVLPEGQIAKQARANVESLKMLLGVKKKV